MFMNRLASANNEPSYRLVRMAAKEEDAEDEVGPVARFMPLQLEMERQVKVEILKPIQ